MESMTLGQWQSAIERMAVIFEQNIELLSKLDSVLGDGDHGVSMARGFRAVSQKVAETEIKDIGQILSTVGRTLISVVGGATGPLFGTIFIKAGALAAGKTEVNLDDLAAMFKSSLEGVKTLGKAEVGEKTMVDALAPAAMRLGEMADSNSPLKEAFLASYEAALAGAESTIPMVATKGRGRYQGEQAIGHQDAGATSITLIFKALSEIQ